MFEFVRDKTRMQKDGHFRRKSSEYGAPLTRKLGARLTLMLQLLLTSLVQEPDKLKAGMVTPYNEANLKIAMRRYQEATR